MKQNLILRPILLVTLVAAMALWTNSAFAARGGKPQPTGTPNATLTFDDLLGDAIGSDGLGPYDATIENGTITLTTGKKRKLSFDFSTCLGGACEDSTGSSTTDSSATMTVNLLKGSAGFQFKGGGGDQLLHVPELEISTFDDDGDGTTDRYVIETSGEAEHRLGREIQRGGRAVEPGSTRFEWIADFSMPWGVQVVVD